MLITDLEALPDAALVARIAALADASRESTAELIAHLVELERRNLHLACGFPSLFEYCRQVLRLSEPESYQRIQAAHAARRFPVILPLLAEGLLHLSAVRLLSPHLVGEDHLALIGAALGKSKRDVERLVARRFPSAPVAASVRKVAAPRAAVAPASLRAPEAPAAPALAAAKDSSGALPPSASGADDGSPTPSGDSPTVTVVADEDAGASTSRDDKRTNSDVPPPFDRSRERRRGEVHPLSACDYLVKFTANEAMVERLRRAQDLLSHSIPDGDIAAVLDRGLVLVIAEASRPGRSKSESKTAPAPRRPLAPGSRTVPAEVKREVRARDDGRCAYVAADGRRCGERRFLQFHHQRPWVVGGPPSVANIALRCRAHNKYEAKVYFDPIRDAREPHV